MADYLQAYATAFQLPVRLNARVTSLVQTDGGFEVQATAEVFQARQVVVATGPFQVRSSPDGRQAGRRGDPGPQRRLPQPPGPPRRPGTGRRRGNSGFQIAEELAATRTVDLSIATTYPMLPQRLAGRDLFWWLTRLGLLRVTVTSGRAGG